MTENKNRARLNEMGWELADTYPERRGNFVFGIVDGKYKGVKYEDNIPPGKRPSAPVANGY